MFLSCAGRPAIFSLTIVLLHNLSALKLKFINGWLYILLQDDLVEDRIHVSINDSKSSSSWSRNTTPDVTRPSPSFTVVMIFYFCFHVIPGTTKQAPSKELHFCIISPQNIFPKIFWIIQMCFRMCKMGLFVIFVQLRVFTTDLSCGDWRFLPNLFFTALIVVMVSPVISFI